MKRAFLFDIDGVLCEPQQRIDKKVYDRIAELGPFVFMVTGNGYLKAIDMLSKSRPDKTIGHNIWPIFYNGADELRNYRGVLQWQDTETPPLHPGVQAYLEGGPLLDDYEGDDLIGNNRFEWRSPRFVNYSIIGRYAVTTVRDSHNTDWRKDFCHAIKATFQNTEAVIGGQVSVDIYSKGADKSRAGKWLNDNGYTFTFIGDKTAPGGNDYPLAEYCRLHPENKCYTSTGPQDTLRILEGLNG